MAVDLSRETAQIRNSQLPGSNWLASGFSKIQNGFRDVQTQELKLAVTEVTTNYVAQFSDNVIINISGAAITVTFPVEISKRKAWFVLSTKGAVTFAGSSGSVLGASNVTAGNTGLVVSDGTNLICGN